MYSVLFHKNDNNKHEIAPIISTTYIVLTRVKTLGAKCLPIKKTIGAN